MLLDGGVKNSKLKIFDMRLISLDHVTYIWTHLYSWFQIVVLFEDIAQTLKSWIPKHLVLIVKLWTSLRTHTPSQRPTIDSSSCSIQSCAPGRLSPGWPPRPRWQTHFWLEDLRRRLFLPRLHRVWSCWASHPLLPLDRCWCPTAGHPWNRKTKTMK